MHRNDDSGDAEKRSAKLTLLLSSLENYVREVVSSDHGMNQEEMLSMIQENFQRSMQANIQYHSDLAQIDQKVGDVKSETFHKLMAQMYKSFQK